MRVHSRLGLGLCFLAIAGAPTLLAGQSPAPPSLGAADSFAVLGGSSVISTGSTVVTGNLGVSPENTISGSITVKVGTTYRNDSVARQAQRDATSAYKELAGRTCTSDLTGQNLGGMTLPPGVYCFSSSAQLTGAPLILRADPNDPNAPWIFQIGSSLATGSSVRVINGGYENNVFWQIGDSVTLGAGTSFLGNVLAHKDITLHSGANVSGRLLAQGVVSLDGNNVSLCCGHITLSPATLPNGKVGAPYTPISITAGGGAGTYAFSVSSGKLPDGLSFNIPAPGIISGTPTKTGTFNFTLTATDSHGCTGTQAYVIAISCQTITVNNPAVNMGIVNVTFSQTFTASDTIGTKTFTLNSGTLPAGLTLSTAGVLSGMPTQIGTFPTTVMVTDSAGCTATSSTYNLVISCQTIAVTAANPFTPNGTVSTPFSQQFTQTGAFGNATFTTADSLPAGLSLSAGGLLSGTPTQTGLFPIVVKVTDANGCTGLGLTYMLFINPAGCSLVLSPITLPSGTPGVPYNEGLTASGGVAPYIFSLSGPLPAGLIFMQTTPTTATITGIPTSPGCSTFDVTAIDVNGCTIIVTYTICVAAGGPTLTGLGIVVLSILLAGVGWVAIRKEG